MLTKMTLASLSFATLTSISVFTQAPIPSMQRVRKSARRTMSGSCWRAISAVICWSRFTPGNSVGRSGMRGWIPLDIAVDDEVGKQELWRIWLFVCVCIVRVRRRMAKQTQNITLPNAAEIQNVIVQIIFGARSRDRVGCGVIAVVFAQSKHRPAILGCGRRTVWYTDRKFPAGLNSKLFIARIRDHSTKS